MRSDMAKVIVERPRIRGRAWKKPKGYAQKLRSYGEEGPPRREGIKLRWGHGTKFLNEHLGPLRRYLDSQVGRPWDKVYSEICAHINRNSAVQDHVRDHVDDYVVVNVIMIDGVPCNGGPGWRNGWPLHQMGPRSWYVCPRSGILKKLKTPRRTHRRKKPQLPAYIRVSDTLQCRPIKGVWHLVTLKPLRRATDPRQERDILLNRPLSQIDNAIARKHYGALVYAVACRVLPRRELRQYPIPIEFCSF